MNEYQTRAQNTADPTMDDDKRLAIAGLGIAGEAGEVADLIKKRMGHGHVLDQDKLVGELGDVLWYVQEVAWMLGVTLDEVARVNIDKLRQRYPNGFESHRSINRAGE